MKKKMSILILSIFLVGLVGFFYPKNIGAPLCGPVCPSLGLHYWKKDCVGFKKGYSCPMGFSNFLLSIFGMTPMCTDSSLNYCFGLSLGEKKCYGVPYTEFKTLTPLDKELSCDYPCGDMTVKYWCENTVPDELENLIINCEWLSKNCEWK